MYAVRWDEGALGDLRQMRLRACEVRQIVDAVDEQLTHEPDRESKRKKTIRPGEDTRPQGRYCETHWVEGGEDQPERAG